jgi:hypothetical protein
MKTISTSTAAATALAALLLGSAAGAAEPPPAPPLSLVDQRLIADLRRITLADAVVISLAAPRPELDAAQIEALDEQWRSERDRPRQPLIARIMASPASVELRSAQAASLGLINEVIVFDRHGLNVGLSAVSSDYWQGDEDKWSKTVPVGPDAVFVDEPEWSPERAVWIVQIDFSISDPKGGQPLGAAAVEVNLTELERRHAAGL